MRGTIHWVSVPHSLDAEVRLYDRLFMVEYRWQKKIRSLKI